jgi:hypothetical protein
MDQDNIAPSGLETPMGANSYTDYAIPAATSSGYPEPLWFPEDRGSIFLLMLLQCVISKKAVLWYFYQ